MISSRVSSRAIRVTRCRQYAARLTQISRQSGEKVDRIDLQLIRQAQRSISRIGQLDGVGHLNRQSKPPGDVELTTDRGSARLRAGVRVGVPVLHLDAVLGGVRQQPILSFAVAFHVGSRHVLGMVRHDGGEPSACSRVILAVECPVVTAPTERGFQNGDPRPARASSSAVARPVNPAPTTATS